MVSKAQKKIQKKKVKEKETRKKILMKRADSRAKAKEEREEHRRDKRVKKFQREMAGIEIWEEEVLKKMPDKTFDQLEHNAKILRALEEEHEKEMDEKRNLNEGLESDGHLTLNDKLQSLHQETAEQQKKKFGMTGSAECKMNIAPKVRKDTAEVEFIKSSVVEDTEDTENSEVS